MLALKAFLIGGLLVCLTALSQQDDVKSKEELERLSKLKLYIDRVGSGKPTLILDSLGVDAFPCDKEAPNTNAAKACFAARTAYYEYFATGLARRTKVYEWNNFSTKVIFLTVLALVAVGVYLSWKQFLGFWKAVPAPRSEGAAAATALAAGEEQQEHGVVASSGSKQGDVAFSERKDVTEVEISINMPWRTAS